MEQLQELAGTQFTSYTSSSTGTNAQILALRACAAAHARRNAGTQFTSFTSSFTGTNAQILTPAFAANAPSGSEVDSEKQQACCHRGVSCGVSVAVKQVNGRNSPAATRLLSQRRDVRRLRSSGPRRD
jgi:hypothetical protein